MTSPAAAVPEAQDGREGEQVMRVAEALMARWEDRSDPTRNSLTIIGQDPRTVASVALSAAVREGERELLEYATAMTDGSRNVWPDDPELDAIYPLAKRVEHGQRNGGRVLRRRIVVIEDWSEVAAPSLAAPEETEQ